MQFSTKLIQPGPQREFGAVITPIHLSSTFLQPVGEDPGTFCYQRGGNPTRAEVETVLASLESAKFARAYATGMAATAAVFNHLQTGDEVLLSASVYGGTYRFVTNYFARRGLKYRFLDDLNQLEAADLSPKTRLIFTESPTNPTLRVVDIARLAELAHSAGALLVVDNTFSTSYLQKPLELGADVSLYSATKYLGGHADLLAGALITNTDTLDEDFALAQSTLGAPLSPFDSYSLLRGLKTLSVRLDRQQANAAKLLEFLKTRSEISQIYYPGSFSPAEAAIQAQQSTGIGAVFSFELRPDLDLNAFLSALEVVGYAVSLGGVESLICQPATMTHESYSPADLEKANITPQLLRLAVGIEDVIDLRNDFVQALAAAQN